MSETVRKQREYLFPAVATYYQEPLALALVRGLGLMQGIGLVKERATKEPHPQAVLDVFEETKRRGVLIGKGGLHGHVIRTGMPLIAQRGHVDELVEALDAGLAKVAPS